MHQDNAEKNENSIEEVVKSSIERINNLSNIRMEDEIFYDLGIYGDDLYEIFEDLIQIYGVDYSSIDVSRIAPGEGGGLMAWISRHIYRKNYISFTVKDLVDYTSNAVNS